MERSPSWSDRQTYAAWFEDGPRDGTVTFVLGLDSGLPPELLLTPDRPGDVYVRAGGERGDGSLPYLFMPKNKVVALRHLGRRRPADHVTNTS